MNTNPTTPDAGDTPAKQPRCEGSPTPTGPESVNCGRCALLKRNFNDGFGICGSSKRFLENGYRHPTVSLDQTCQYSKLSARFDPDFARREDEKFIRAQEEDYNRHYGK